MSLFWNSLRATSRSDCAPQKNLKSFQWSRVNGVASYWNTMLLLMLVGNTLRLCAWGSIVFPTACSSCVLEVAVILVELDKVLEAGTGPTLSFHTSIDIFRTSGGDRPCDVMGIFANIPARELFLCRSLMCSHLVQLIFSLRDNWTPLYWIKPISKEVWRSCWCQSFLCQRPAFSFRRWFLAKADEETC